MKQNWVHIIGICGITTSGVAVMFKNMGWEVTGSDKGFFPPVSDFLKAHDIAIQPGFKLSRLHQGNKHPDMVIFQGTKGDKNEEYQEARRLGIKMYSFAEILRDQVIVPNSIVVSGSFGKTTTTAILRDIFLKAGKKISFMVGGLSPDLAPTVVNKQDDTEYSLVEGDEYLNTLEDKRSKFFFYSPKYLILTGIAYDHADLFPSMDAYLLNFKRLLEQMPEDGLVVANIGDQNIQKIIDSAPCKVVTFSLNSSASSNPDWILLNTTKPLPCLVKNPQGKGNIEIIPFERKVIGNFYDANILAAAVMAYELGIKKEDIQEAVKEFRGIKRRLEIKYQQQGRMLVDDFGSAPAKAKTSLMALRDEFPGVRLIAVFEPNAGSRVTGALGQFNQAFDLADVLILPRFTVLPHSTQTRFTESDLQDELSGKKLQVEFIPNDGDLVNYLTQQWFKQDKILIVFMGSHSFRGMIVKLIQELIHADKKAGAKKH